MNIKQQIVEELHRPARKNFTRRRVILKGLNDLYQADLVEMIPYSKVNKGYRYILVIINAFSKFVWAYPIKRKSGEEVSEAMKKLFSNKKNIPKNLQTDMGKEFYNKSFQHLMQVFNVNHYSTYSSTKSSIVERCNRTLKNMMWKQFSLQGTYKWLDYLPKLVKKYNSTSHRTTGFRPIDVNKKNEQQLLTSVYSHTKTIDPKRSKLKVGDYVRVSKYREAFVKGYTPNWSNELFKITKVQWTNPATYVLEDQNKQEIKGGFYQHELQKTKHPDVYLVEKVLRTKGDQVLVKWLGFDNTHNSWISKTNVV